jgi:menaquinone-dependent protoporphyrinogen IX oxidase
MVFGTRSGSTEEIVNKVKEFLEKKDVISDVYDLSDLKKKNWPSIDDYEGIIIASSIKGSFWRNEPKVFLKENGIKILEQGKILGIFISSAYSLIDEEKAKERYLEKLLKTYNLNPHISEIFGPVFDFSKESKLSILEKKLLKLTVKTIVKQTGIKVNESQRNDFRDWKKIERFADKFSLFLTNKHDL